MFDPSGPFGFDPFFLPFLFFLIPMALWSLAQWRYLNLFEQKTGVRPRWTRGIIRKFDQLAEAKYTEMGTQVSEMDKSAINDAARYANLCYFLVLAFFAVFFLWNVFSMSAFR